MTCTAEARECKESRLKMINYFYREAFLSYRLRRGDVTDIARGFARLEIKCLISNQHFTARCKCGSVISQLRVLASHKTNFESVAQGA